MKKHVRMLLLFSMFYTAGFSQEYNPKAIAKRIFPGAPLPKEYVFRFPYSFEEKFITASDGKRINALLFKCKDPKGVILYLHGNAEALDQWGQLAPVYTALHYDILMIDYRGYGKSEGTISSETQLYSDVQAAYDLLLKSYTEKNIVVVGYSIGTGPAAMLAARNHPQQLILQAPYYSMTDLVQHWAPGIDTALIPFQLNTSVFLQKITVPVNIFHGDADETVYYGSSQKLKQFLKPGDKLITLKGAGHTGMTTNKDYLDGLRETLK